jgi:hypothetical protein
MICAAGNRAEPLLTTPTESSAWPWPDSLDALVAAPGYHRLLLENEHVRVLETRIPPGHTVPVHTHRWPCVIQTRATGDYLRRDEKGNLLTDSRTANPPRSADDAHWVPPMPPHSVENIGATEIVLYTVELKRAPSP